MRQRPLPSVEELTAAFLYDPATGVFRHARDKNGGPRTKQGDIAGSLSKGGYWTLCLNDRRMKAHRIAWKMMTGADPVFDIDHKNTLRSDNRFVNLRDAFIPQNARNAKKQKRKADGYKGVSNVPTKRSKHPWRAHIRVDYKLLHLGVFRTAEEAHAAYVAAAQQHFGEFANAG